MCITMAGALPSAKGLAARGARARGGGGAAPLPPALPLALPAALPTAGSGCDGALPRLAEPWGEPRQELPSCRPSGPSVGEHCEEALLLPLPVRQCSGPGGGAGWASSSSPPVPLSECFIARSACGNQNGSSLLACLTVMAAPEDLEVYCLLAASFQAQQALPSAAAPHMRPLPACCPHPPRRALLRWGAHQGWGSHSAPAGRRFPQAGAEPGGSGGWDIREEAQ